MKKRSGFTLIELLIVVAIIAILAAIAVPNFLEAQVRAKVSRAKADMRSIATALEAYLVDNNKYPDLGAAELSTVVPPIRLGLGFSRAALAKLSTPVAYITQGLLVDPFAVTETATTFFGYANARAAADGIGPGGAGPTSLQAAAVNVSPASTLDQFFQHSWLLQSVGPDRVNFALQTTPTSNFNLAFHAITDQLPGDSLGFFYDPTNGTISQGDVIRSGKISIP